MEYLALKIYQSTCRSAGIICFGSRFRTKWALQTNNKGISWARNHDRDKTLSLIKWQDGIAHGYNDGHLGLDQLCFIHSASPRRFVGLFDPICLSIEGRTPRGRRIETPC